MIYLKNEGNVLIMVCMLIALLAILAGPIIYLSVNEYYSAVKNMNSVEMYYLAEAGTEQLANLLVNKIANYESEPSGINDYWADLCGETTGFLSSGYTLDYTCQSAGAEYIVDNNGIISFVRQYTISSIVTNPEDGVTVKVRQMIARNKTYTFQHAVFYTEDLEMIPGRDMNLSGRIHSNDDIYIDSNGATFTIDTDYLNGVGKIYKKRKDSGFELSGTVNIWNQATSTFRGMHEAGDSVPMDSDHPDWIDASQVRWGGTVKSGVHGVTSLAVPSVGSVQEGGFYYQKADVKVINGDVYCGGSKLVEGVNVPVGTVTVDEDFYNNRESKNVKMSNIDLKKLSGWEQDVDSDGNPVFDSDGNPVEVQNYPNYLPDNGLIYATNNNAAPSQQPGVRLVNGTEINSGVGLTVVSNVPVYVQGDYNTVNKKPAAVICDAINLLSNNWDDANSSLDLSERVAQSTTVNVAIITGIVPTVGGVYSGGLENLPRMHEKWSGKTLYIRGSFVVLWNSLFGTNPWAYGGDYYTAPNRDWDYDLDFNDSSNLPPMTPFAVGARRIAWWR